MEGGILQPPLYFAQNHIWNVCFHPKCDIIACSQISGNIEILKYTSDDVTPVVKVKDIHKSSARDCRFNPSGTMLATCAKDKRIGFINQNGQTAHIIKKAHDSSINRVRFIDDHTLMSGDDEGIVKIWDLRTPISVFEAHSQGEAITGLLYDPTSNYLFSTCLEGTVAVYDVRQGSESSKNLIELSDSVDQELLGIQKIKNGRYIACPSSEGSIFLYKWGQFSEAKDRIQGHPNSIDAMLKIGENSLISGSEDGCIRGVSVYPNKILSVLGQHQEQQNFPIQSLSISHCENIVASSSHDNSIKFYDVSDFIKKRKDVLEGEEIVGEQMLKQGRQDEDYSSIDSDSNDSTDLRSKNGKKKSNVKARQEQIKKQKKMVFFKDLAD